MHIKINIFYKIIIVVDRIILGNYQTDHICIQQVQTNLPRELISFTFHKNVYYLLQKYNPNNFDWLQIDGVILDLWLLLNVQLGTVVHCSAALEIVSRM